MKFITSVLSRYIFAATFTIFGLFHLMGAKNMAVMVPLPGGEFWVYLTGLAMIAAAVSIFTGKLTRLACLLLALLLLVYVAFIHAPGVIHGGDVAQLSMMNLLKDIGLMGGALLLADRYEK